MQILPPPPLNFLKGDFGLSTIPPSAVLIKMQVSELDLAEFPHSYLRNRIMTCGNRTICCGNAQIVRNFRTIDWGISAPYTVECARYDADPCAHDKRRKMRTICWGNSARSNSEIRKLESIWFDHIICWLYGSLFDIKKPDHVDWDYIHYSFTS